MASNLGQLTAQMFKIRPLSKLTPTHVLHVHPPHVAINLAPDPLQRFKKIVT
jgi:hypothetical protein